MSFKRLNGLCASGVNPITLNKRFKPRQLRFFYASRKKMVSDSGIGRFLSLEILATLGVSLVAIGVSWGALNNDVLALEAQAKVVQDEQQEIADDVNEIKTSIELIKNEQIHIKEDLEERGEDIKWIRQALERDHR